MGGAVLLARTIHPIPGVLVAYGRYAATRIGEGEIIYVGEGWNASVAVSRLSNGVLNYHNAGKVQASSEPQDMRLQRMLGHMTTLIPKNPVIGARDRLRRGRDRRRGVGRSERQAPDDRGNRAARAARGLALLRPAQLRRRRQSEDARRPGRCAALPADDAARSSTRSRPTRSTPGSKGAAMLYTKEFFETVKAHLNPGGAVTLFVQLYESNTAAVKSEIATFLEVFPGGVVWGNTNNGAGLRSRAARTGRADADRRRGRAASPERSRRWRPSRIRSARSGCTRRSICFRTTPA